MKISKARIRADELIGECGVLATQLETMYEMYGKVYAEYERRMQILRTYKSRGIVTEGELPKIRKRGLDEQLRELRNK